MPARQGRHSALAWRKSSASGESGGCVEIASNEALVLVRDSRDRSGAMIAFPSAQWSAFIRRIRNENQERY